MTGEMTAAMTPALMSAMTDAMAAVLLAAIVAAMVMMLIRAAKGPGLFNRVLAINTFGTLTVVLLVLLGVEFDQHNLMDIALLYVLLNFVAAVSVLRFFEDRKLPVYEPQAPELDLESRGESRD